MERAGLLYRSLASSQKRDQESEVRRIGGREERKKRGREGGREGERDLTMVVLFEGQ